MVTYCAHMRNARYPNHNLSRHLNFTDLGALEILIDCGQVFHNREANIIQSLSFGLSLRPAAGQAGTTDVISLRGLMQNYLIFHILLACLIPKFYHNVTSFRFGMDQCFTTCRNISL